MNRLLSTQLFVILFSLAFNQAKAQIYWIEPKLKSQIWYFTPNYQITNAFNVKGNIFVFGNHLDKQSQVQPWVFVEKPEPTFKRLIEQDSLILLNATIADSGFTLAGTTLSKPAQGWIAKLDEKANLLWLRVMDFEQDNSFSFAAEYQGKIFAVGKFYDQDFLANLQLITLDSSMNLIQGKSLLIGKDFEIRQLLRSDSKLILLLNTSVEPFVPMIAVFSEDLNLDKILRLSRLKNVQLWDMFKHQGDYWLCGQQDNHPFVLRMDSSFRITWQKQLHECPAGCTARQIRPFGDDFLLNIVCQNGDDYKSFLLSISEQGFIQWKLPEAKGITFLFPQEYRRTFSTIHQDGNYLSLNLYRLKNPFIWSKTVQVPPGSSLIFSQFTQGQLSIITGNNANLEIWRVSPSGKLLSHKPLQIQPSNVSRIRATKRSIFLLTTDRKLVKLQYNNRLKTYDLQYKAEDFLPLSQGFVFLTRTDSGFQATLTDKALGIISAKKFRFLGKLQDLSAIAGTWGIAIAALVRQDTNLSLVVLGLNQQIELQYRFSYTLKAKINRLKAMDYANGLYALVDQGVRAKLFHLSPQGKLLWQKLLDVQNANDLIAVNQRLVIASGQKKRILLSFFTLQGKPLKNVQIMGLDGRYTLLTKTKYLYLTTYNRQLDLPSLTSIKLKP